MDMVVSIRVYSLVGVGRRLCRCAPLPDLEGERCQRFGQLPGQTKALESFYRFLSFIVSERGLKSLSERL